MTLCWLAMGADSIPTCGSENINQLIYDTNDTVFKTCTSSGWKSVDLQGEKGDSGADGADGADGAAGSDATYLTFTAKSADYTATAKDNVLVTTSGSDVTITLPAMPTSGDTIGVQYRAQTLGDTVTIDGNGKTIDGQSSIDLYVADSTLKLYDKLIMEYDGSNWLITSDDRVAHSTRMTLTTAITANTASVTTDIDLDNAEFDIGGIADTTTDNRVEIRRTGLYYVSISSRPNSTLAADKYSSSILDNSSGTVLTCGTRSPSISGVINASCSATLKITAGEYLKLKFKSDDTNKGITESTEYTFLSVTEVR